MKRKFIFLGVLASLLLGVGCERAELAKDADAVERTAVATSANEYKISRSEALSALRKMLQCMNSTEPCGAWRDCLAGIDEKDLLHGNVSDIHAYLRVYVRNVAI